MPENIINLNVGVLGHVDSGKTTLSKALSTIASTAAFDKNPQSQERGITIDLGFSSLAVEPPDHLRDKCSQLQFTFVDCPGHASLIRTIIGGAQIIDVMLLVLDVTKGMQTQTAECLIVGNITSQKMIVVLNKIDLLPPSKRNAAIEKMKKKMALTLKNTKFTDAPIVCVAAKPGGPDTAEQSEPIGTKELIEEMKKISFIPERKTKSPFVFSIDHCFSIKGQGTVMTGTILQGTVNINDNVEIPILQITKKVKSMQMFHRPVEKAIEGDRLGICVTQFDPKLIERGIACSPGYVPIIYAAILPINRVAYFKEKICTRSKFHISLGHETVMAKVSLFQELDTENSNSEVFNFEKEYAYLEEVSPEDSQTSKSDDSAATANLGTELKTYALLELEHPVPAVPGSLVIGSRLDGDIHANVCRLAFWGRLIHSIDDKSYLTSVLPKLRVFKEKHKSGVVERASNEMEVIGKSMFKKESNIQVFIGLSVKLSTGEGGVIEGSFGQSGKVKIRIPGGLKETTYKQLSGASKKKGKQSDASTTESEIVRFELHFKRYVYDVNKTVKQ
ncbi:selenocysteine-specific elongation factor [Ischnura elegans]|uniref:selenocysteine-specific elongation factor n=1 Tax=Ischnura elegans TaxID=197161 RepID=UPI001ED87CC5|nr:selenocysteine-specific elongation factor [Ischnura elegans]